jgi:hypothetical protein
MNYLPISLFSLISFNCLSMLCGPPNSISDAEKNSARHSIIIEGRFASIVEEGEDIFYFQLAPGKERVTVIPFQVILLDKVKMISGDDRSKMYIKFRLDGGLTGHTPLPPQIIGERYVFSFQENLETEDGSIKAPFEVGPCNLYLTAPKFFIYNKFLRKYFWLIFFCLLLLAIASVVKKYNKRIKMVV